MSFRHQKNTNRLQNASMQLWGPATVCQRQKPHATGLQSGSRVQPVSKVARHEAPAMFQMPASRCTTGVEMSALLLALEQALGSSCSAPPPAGNATAHPCGPAGIAGLRLAKKTTASDRAGSAALTHMRICA